MPDRARDREGRAIHDRSAGGGQPRAGAASRGLPVPAWVATLAALTLAAGPVGAAEGLYLTWNDCFLGPTAASNLAFACNTNLGEAELYCALTMSQATDNVLAAEVVVDLQHSSATLPDWWRFDPGGCRLGTSLAAAASFPGRTACADMWQGADPAAIAAEPVYVPSEPFGAASQARIKVAVSVLPQAALSLNATDMYYAARLVLRYDRSTGSPWCPGCGEAACLVLNSILIGRVPGSPGGDLFLQTPGPGGANWARWQGGDGADCAAVPVRNRAWGQLKGLYR